MQIKIIVIIVWAKLEFEYIENGVLWNHGL